MKEGLDTFYEWIVYKEGFDNLKVCIILFLLSLVPLTISYAKFQQGFLTAPNISKYTFFHSLYFYSPMQINFKIFKVEISFYWAQALTYITIMIYMK